MEPQTHFKICPRCQTSAPLNAARCDSCGREYTTKFEAPPLPPEPEKTQFASLRPGLPSPAPPLPMLPVNDRALVAAPDESGKATTALVLGCVGLIAWLLPIIGLPVTITGLVLGIKSINSRNKGLAIAGIVLCGIGIAFSAVNVAFGAYLVATGQHPLFPPR